MTCRSEQLKRKKTTVSKVVNTTDTEEEDEDYFLISFSEELQNRIEYAIVKSIDISLATNYPDTGVFKYRGKKYTVNILKRG